MKNLEISEWFIQNKSNFSGTLTFDEPLSKHTYYRIGGPAQVFAIPKSKDDILWLIEGLRITKAPLFILGMGSNLLVSDAGFPGVVIRATRINLEMDALDCDRHSPLLKIRTGASVAVSSLLRKAAQEGWGGLEFLTGIPGSIGGVVTMNAGTHLGEAQSKIRKVEAFSFQPQEKNVFQSFEGSQLQFQYRKNLFLPKTCLIWAAEWEVIPADPVQVKRQIDDVLVRRKSTQPLDFPSCGSVFKNPHGAGLSAWQVIDKLGLRGHRIGDAVFSEKHSNFILNLGQAKAEDVRALIQLAKQKAQQELKITLEEEVIYLGDF